MPEIKEKETFSIQNVASHKQQMSKAEQQLLTHRQHCTSKTMQK